MASDWRKKLWNEKKDIVAICGMTRKRRKYPPALKAAVVLTCLLSATSWRGYLCACLFIYRKRKPVQRLEWNNMDDNRERGLSALEDACAHQTRDGKAASKSSGGSVIMGGWIAAAQLRGIARTCGMASMKERITQ